MQITYTLVVALVDYVSGAITKTFIAPVPDKYIPIQNVLIGLASGFVCYFLGIETDIVQALILCLIAATGAGGIYDLVQTKKEEKQS